MCHGGGGCLSEIKRCVCSAVVGNTKTQTHTRDEADGRPSNAYKGNAGVCVRERVCVLAHTLSRRTL